MRVSTRAALAVSLLVGFHVLVLGIVAGLIGIELWALSHARFVALKLAFVIVPLIYAVLRGYFTISGRQTGAEPGIPVSPEQQPQLWRLVRDLAGQVGTRPPEFIRITDDVNAAVSERTRFLGLIAGHRTLYLGAPLLAGFSERQLISVLAHELGHYSNRDTRWSALIYRGRLSMIKAGSRLDDEKWLHRIIGRLFRFYVLRYILLTADLVRRQEFAADVMSARCTDSATAVSALREVALLDTVWRRFLGQRVFVGWDAGYLPAHIFTGFLEQLAEPARQAEYEQLRHDLDGEETSPFDSHPPMTARIAALESLGAVPAAPITDRRALALLNQPLDLLEYAYRHDLVDEAKTKRLADFGTVQSAGLRFQLGAAAAEFLDHAGRATGGPATLRTVLDAVDAGRLAALDGTEREAGPDLGARARRELSRPVVEGGLTNVVMVALVDAGQARWKHDWASEPGVQITGPDAEQLHDSIVDALVEGGSTASLRGLLTAAGVPLDYHPAGTRPTVLTGEN
ncbi:Zn-dependent protease [Pseudonocardiaceae bacterium YIM PH 21723]|nr:Zn-dependent protease [Pseudonocardiaceae bacterium YIM PH 21723]